MVSAEIFKKARQMREAGKTYREICRALNIGHTTLYRIVGKKERNLGASEGSSSGWVINHPYADSLREEERERYLEVIKERQKKNPDMGWDYKTQQQVSYKNGVIHKPC